MKTLSRILVLISAIAGSALLAQENGPAPTVTSAPPPSAPAPAPMQIDGLIHVQKLPSSAQLMADAEAEGMSVTRMEQLPDRTIVTYRYASGNVRTFAYTTTLPEDPDTATRSVGTDTPPPAPTSNYAAPAPNYTVIYSEPAPVYYAPRYAPAYDPYWPTTSVSIGLGFGRTFGGYGRGYYGPSRYYSPSHHDHWRR